jgi:hypothetical protein
LNFGPRNNAKTSASRLEAAIAEVGAIVGGA